MLSDRSVFLLLLVVLNASALKSMINEKPSGNLDIAFLQFPLTQASSPLPTNFLQEDQSNI